MLWIRRIQTQFNDTTMFHKQQNTSYGQKANNSKEQEVYLAVKSFKDLKDARSLLVISAIRRQVETIHNDSLVQMLREGSSHTSR